MVSTLTDQHSCSHRNRCRECSCLQNWVLTPTNRDPPPADWPPLTIAESMFSQIRRAIIRALVQRHQPHIHHVSCSTLIHQHFGDQCKINKSIMNPTHPKSRPTHKPTMRTHRTLLARCKRQPVARSQHEPHNTAAFQRQCHSCDLR